MEHFYIGMPKFLLMTKPFQNSLLLCTKKYSLYNLFIEVLNELSSKVYGFDIREKIDPLWLKIHPQMIRFPFRIRNSWDKILLAKTNSRLLSEISKYKPELVFVYNSEFLLPETCVEIKRKAKLIFFMGDSPFYTPQNPYYLTCLTYADLILSPDTFWISQLNTMGIHKTSFFVPGIDTSSYYLIVDNEILDEIENLEILYSGSSYVNSWGYKKALLMSSFIDLNFKLYGNSAWKRWFRFFPKLESVFTETEYIPTTHLNKMFNKTKMIPVDGNPAILNGFHLRLFEVLGSGAFPLIEYRKDVEELLFSGCDVKVPLIKDYKKAADLAKYYLKNENDRKQIIDILRNYILINYNAKRNSERIISLL
jgi:hypothetical protein